MKNKHSLVKKKNRLMKRLFQNPPDHPLTKKIVQRIYAYESALKVDAAKRIEL